MSDHFNNQSLIRRKRLSSDWSFGGERDVECEILELDSR
jgi:hypothetical protein